MAIKIDHWQDILLFLFEKLLEILLEFFHVLDELCLFLVNLDRVNPSTSSTFRGGVRSTSGTWRDWA
ncbi:MAG: hypothetical protein V2A78_04770 [bacterium]